MKPTDDHEQFCELNDIIDSWGKERQDKSINNLLNAAEEGMDYGPLFDLSEEEVDDMRKQIEVFRLALKVTKISGEQ